MQREVRTTEDGSKTLFINDLDEGYHSHHGALQEAKHVFIDNGLKLLNNYEINILELGFGTGLNLLVTIDEFLQNQKYNKNHIIHYYTIEKYPVLATEIESLDYSPLFTFPNAESIFKKAHDATWGSEVELLPNFYLTKFEVDFFSIPQLNIPQINLVYYDCFGAKVQPDLWEKPLFEMVSDLVKSNGLLTTYSSKGSVRRILQELNFNVEKVPGPPGKREMINAWKA